MHTSERLPLTEPESHSSKERRATAAATAELTRAIARGEDGDRHAVVLALQILEDIDAGLYAPCACGRGRDGCAGPANHWTPLPLVPASRENVRLNLERRTTNASRLETLLWVVHVLERNPADADALDLERYRRWIRDHWRCGPFPSDEPGARRTWAARVCNAAKAPPAPSRREEP